MNEVGVGSRVLNFLVDTVLVFLISFGLYKWWSFYVFYWQYKYFPYYMFFYVTLFFYYTFFEIIAGRTPGKWLSMTRVRTTAGQKPAFYQILLRSLLRLTIVDPFFIAVLKRPLHDALSKTRVVEV
jgi:uncharacterized RDD family membrane protein YckC